MKRVFNRRELLMLSGGAVIGASASAAPTSAAAQDVNELLATDTGTTVVLQDRRLPLPVELQGRLAGNGARLLPLECSEGTRPRWAMTCRADTKRRESLSSTAMVSAPAQ